MFQYILFDLDGTLVDSGPGVTNAVAYTLRKWGKEVPDRRSLERFIGPPLPWSFQTYHGYTREQSLQAVQDYREYYRAKGVYEAEVYAGIPELLQELKRRGRTLIVATSKPDVFAEQVLSHLGLRDSFDFIAAASLDEKTRATKADVIRYAIEACGIRDLNRMVMIGDREHDVIGAKTVGIASIGVLFGFGSREELEKAGAGWLAERPGDILRLVESRGESCDRSSGYRSTY